MRLVDVGDAARLPPMLTEPRLPRIARLWPAARRLATLAQADRARRRRHLADPRGTWLDGRFGGGVGEALRVIAAGLIEGFLACGVDPMGLSGVHLAGVMRPMPSLRCGWNATNTLR
jgi:hypothetical protein